MPHWQHPLRRIAHRAQAIGHCSATLEVERVSRAGSARPRNHLQAVPEIVPQSARGAVAVWGTCWEGEGAPGYWPWIQVVRALVRDGGEGEAVLAGQSGLLQLTSLTADEVGQLLSKVCGERPR